MALVIPGLSISPSIHKGNNRLVIDTSWTFRVMTLALGLRQVIVDPKQRVVVIYQRSFWFFKKTKTIPFAHIKAVSYNYQDVNPGASWSWGHDTTDSFTVGLKLVDFERVHLFTFFGEGPFQNNGPLPDWLYWEEYLFDVLGDQEKQSRAFVELLAKMIDVTIEP